MHAVHGRTSPRYDPGPLVAETMPAICEQVSVSPRCRPLESANAQGLPYRPAA